MRSILSIIVLLLLFQGADAFVPRPATPGIVAPWGVAERLKTDSPAEPSKQKKTRKPRIFQLVLPTHTRVAPATLLQAAASSGGPSSEGGPTRIIIAGAPASGKGTQCEKIKAKFGVVHLSTGDMLRAAVAAGTDIGKEAKAYMDSGKLVPDSTIIGVVRKCDMVVILALFCTW
jgi:adenylate kinase